MSQSRADRMRENFLRQGGRPTRRTTPESESPLPQASGPGKKADERIVSLSVDEILPDRYQGRLRWPVELEQIERLYGGEWDAQDLLGYVASQRASGDNPALAEAWQSIEELARSILSEGQVVPITVTPARELPVGYRYVIETGEGRFWAYQMMRWLLNHDPDALDVPVEAWQEDPAYISAIAVSDSSRLRQVAENEQRQSYASAVDRAVAYASMLAEDAGYEVTGTPPGIRGGILELPDAYWRAARRGLRGRRAVTQQVPTGKRQIQRHLKLLTDLDPQVLAMAKQNGLSEAQLRPLIGKSPNEQRAMTTQIIAQGLSSREAESLRERLERGEDTTELPPAQGTEKSVAAPLTLPEEVSRLLRTLTRAAARYEELRTQASDHQLRALIEVELRSYDDTARGRRRLQTPRKRVSRLIAFLQQWDEE